MSCKLCLLSILRFGIFRWFCSTCYTVILCNINQKTCADSTDSQSFIHSINQPISFKFQMQRSITRQEPTFPARQVFSPFNYQSSSDGGPRAFPPTFIQPQRQDATLSVSPEYAIGTTPPKHSQSAKDNLKSILEVTERRPSIDKTAQTEDTDPLMNVQCSDLTRESSFSAVQGGIKPSENGIVKRTKSGARLPMTGFGSPTNEEFVPPKKIRESLQGRSSRSQRNYRIQEDAIIEDNAKTFSPSLPDNSKMQWEVVSSPEIKGNLLFELSDDDSSKIWKDRSRTDNLKGAEAAFSPETDYQAPLFSLEGKDKWEQSTPKNEHFGSVKARSRRRKHSTDMSTMSQHEKLLRRRNAHKRWHSEHLTKNETKKILGEARDSEFESNGVDHSSSSLPDHEEKWIHGKLGNSNECLFPYFWATLRYG